MCFDCDVILSFRLASGDGCERSGLLIAIITITTRRDPHQMIRPRVIGSKHF